MKDSVYVTSKGRLVVPVRLRRKYGIKAGTKVRFVERDREIVLQPVTRQYIRSVCGMLAEAVPATPALLKERAHDKRREEARGGKSRSRWLLRGRSL
jgi:AbrB family looped-hinge helix DNA binding protein